MSSATDAAERSGGVVGRGTQPVLEISGLSKSFPGARVLSDVSFSVGPGRIHALLGHNGSGKSTLIKILAGVYTPDSGGTVLIRGEPLAFGHPRDSSQHGLRFVHQDLGLIGDLSTLENMALTWGYPRSAVGAIRWREHRDRVRSALGRLGVEVDLDAPVRTIRPVARTAVAIARALGSADDRISVLVLDEPTAALPPAEVEALFDILRDVRDQGVSIIYVSHRLEEVLSLAQDASILRDGQLQQTLELDGVDRTQLVQLIVGNDTSAPAAPARHQTDTTRASSAEAAFDVEVDGPHLHGVRLALHRGEIVGVAGLSGSGREEICQAIIGGGVDQCIVHDRSTGHTTTGVTPAVARDLGVCLVLPNRAPAAAISAFSMRENITLPGLRRHARFGFVRRSMERAATAEWMTRLDIRPRDPEHLYGLLSGGNQQKAVLAKWLSIGPRALLLDDPTTGVDVGARARIYDLIRSQASQGLAVVVASSDIEDLVALTSRVIVLARGQVVEELTGSDINEGRILDALNRTPVAKGPLP